MHIYQGSDNLDNQERQLWQAILTKIWLLSSIGIILTGDARDMSPAIVMIDRFVPTKPDAEMFTDLTDTSAPSKVSASVTKQNII